jgi:hypothetical protein
VRFLRVTRTFTLVTVSVLIAVAAAQASHTTTSIRHHAPAASSAKPRLTLKPNVVIPGGRLTFIGTAFRPNEKVWLGVGPPQSEARHWGSTRANGGGAFRKTFTVNRKLDAGHWIAIACQRGCRVKAGASFRTVLGQG